MIGQNKSLKNAMDVKMKKKMGCTLTHTQKRHLSFPLKKKKGSKEERRSLVITSRKYFNTKFKAHLGSKEEI